MLKHLFLFAPFLYTGILTFFSLCKIAPPALRTGIDDKIYHFLAYVMLCFFWGIFFYLKGKHNFKKYAFVISFTFGIVIEILQGIVSYRTSDFYDLAANSLGALLALILLQFFKQNTTPIN
jgi:VanZ family protein